MDDRSGAAAFWRDAALLPNVVSLLRIAMIAAAGIVYMLGYRMTGLYLGIPAGLSDYLDGYLARSRNQCTELGALLDLLADLFFQLVCISLAVFTGVWPLYLLIAWGFRDLTVTVLRASAAQQGFAIRSTFLAKLATNFNSYAFVLMVLDAVRPIHQAQVITVVHWLGLFGIHAGLLMQYISGVMYLRSYIGQYRTLPFGAMKNAGGEK